MALTPEHAIDVVTKVFGRHPGFRSLHAKGLVLKGTFAAAPEAAELTRAAHMQGGDPVPATFRVSNGGGNPHHPDWAPDPRGLAVKFYLPDGSRTDIVAVSSPLFPTRTPEGFVELIAAQGAGAAAAWTMPLFLARHPEALRVIPVVAPTLRPPASYAAIPYYGIHAFKWTDATGGERYVRYTLRPDAPLARLMPWEAKRRGGDYLQQEIRERVAGGPVRFGLEVQIATPGDPVDDPSAAWPKGRRRVRVGTLEITGLDDERETGGDVLVFDPSRVTDGIEGSEDPVLRFRPEAYSESIKRRTGG
ncbi:MAG TPA: catalase family peroxidase [Thermoleophilaceae bacterium]